MQLQARKKRHNPYFNRWFSAMNTHTKQTINYGKVTILILIDGFLQFTKHNNNITNVIVTILILIDGFLQFQYIQSVFRQNIVTILILIDGFLQSRRGVKYEFRRV